MLTASEASWPAPKLAPRPSTQRRPTNEHIARCTCLRGTKRNTRPKAGAESKDALLAVPVHGHGVFPPRLLRRRRRRRGRGRRGRRLRRRLGRLLLARLLRGGGLGRL